MRMRQHHTIAGDKSSDGLQVIDHLGIQQRP
jgi:hypothetical protein